MKNIILIILLILIPFFFFNSCKKDDEIQINKEKVSGFVQKGPFINGTSILMTELNTALEQTGKIFSTQITNNRGSFEINNVSLTSSFVEFSASGFYFDEVKGDISIAPLNLYALSDITDINTVNVNILTHLEKRRVEYLVKQKKSFAEAKKTAQEEILAIFGFENNEMQESETLDISVNHADNAVLLAISLILQGKRNVGDMTELLAGISTDISEDGIMDTKSTITDLRNSTLTLNLQSIRQNLVARYQELGVAATIPNFEKYIADFLAHTATEPIPRILPATNVTVSGATLNGTVNPNSSSTVVTFEYGLTSEYGSSVTALQSPVSGNTDMSVSAEISDLNPGTIYHFRIKAENELGTIYGDDMTFTTLGQVPSVVTLVATNITKTRSILNGTVNANHLNTIVSFEYGLTAEYGNSVTALQSPVYGNTDMSVSAEISDLNPGTIYHFRVKAENELGRGYGEDNKFNTHYDGFTGTLTDTDGNIYKTIGIGGQLWMAENLKTTKYNEGTDIPMVTENTVWEELTTPGYCWYENDQATYGDTYGTLYNWFTVATGNLCPAGWHVPTDAEWTQLTDYLGGESVAGGKLKETGTTHYNSPNTGATNESGFTALPGGYRTSGGHFSGVGNNGLWWNATEYDTDFAWSRYVYYDNSSVSRYYNFKGSGFSVRCLRD